MRYVGISLIYISFYALILLACLHFNSLIPMWALLLSPTIENNKEEEDKISFKDH